MAKKLSEDEVRNIAGSILGFTTTDKNGKIVNIENEEVISGVGQLTTFNELGKRLDCKTFAGINNKPDGWYLPKETYKTAIILETKSSTTKFNIKHEMEIVNNCTIAAKRYHNVIGVLYNGQDIIVYKNGKTLKDQKDLQEKEFYLKQFAEDKIDKQKIFNLTKRINDCLHSDFGIKNLYHRMIFTACALVAKRYGAKLEEGMDYATFHTSILSTLSKSLENDKKQNTKLDLLLEVYGEIRMNSTENQNAIDNFIGWVAEISDSINSDYWNGEDVMAIFFNEFNRYKKKSEKGQVFTPDHITSLMCRLLDIDKDDIVLDAACGSGAFLVKSMCMMIQDAGGVNTKKAKEIKKNQLFGIEFDREVYALACANMLIHKDGKTNLAQLDSRTETACSWIQEKPITKVLMNPPFETKFGCLEIVKNVLDNVKTGTKCAFILPDKKLETDKRRGLEIIKSHTLEKIIKLPENVFFGQGVATSIFIFESGKPQGDKNILGYFIEDDGLETVKNQGRQDVKDKWNSIEDYWVRAIHDGEETSFNTKQIINPAKHLSYQMPEKEFEIYEEDYAKTMMDYLMFKKSINVKEFGDRLITKILYNSAVVAENDYISIRIKKGKDNEQN